MSTAVRLQSGFLLKAGKPSNARAISAHSFSNSSILSFAGKYITMSTAYLSSCLLVYPEPAEFFGMDYTEMKDAVTSMFTFEANAEIIQCVYCLWNIAQRNVPICECYLMIRGCKCATMIWRQLFMPHKCCPYHMQRLQTKLKRMNYVNWQEIMT